MHIPPLVLVCNFKKRRDPLRSPFLHSFLLWRSPAGQSITLTWTQFLRLKWTHGCAPAALLSLPAIALRAPSGQRFIALAEQRV